MTAPQDVAVWALVDRRDTRQTGKPWVVRWRVDRRQFSRAFRTRLEADKIRSRLVTAGTSGEQFCDRTGLPSSMTPSDTPTVFEWAVRWIDDQWDTAEPRTRGSLLESLAFFVAESMRPDAPSLDTAEDQCFRRYLRQIMPPAADCQDREPGGAHRPERIAGFDRRLQRHSPHLHELDRDRLAQIERRLRTRLDGGPRGSSGDRHVKNAKRCLRRAFMLGLLPADPWPEPERGESRRKASRARKAQHRADIRRLPARGQVLLAIEAMRSHQPASRMYQVMTRLALDIGARPSEIVDVEFSRLHLPAQGWGQIEVPR